MSNSTNTKLLERAAVVSEEYAGTYLPQAIDKAIADNDLERLEFMVTNAEAELAKEDFYNLNQLEQTDVF